MALGTGSRENTIGDSLDGHSDPTIFGRVRQITEHIHSANLCIPSLAGGVLVTSKNIAWTLGDNFAVIAATNAITSDFDFHWLNIEDGSNNGVYELWLYYGADASEVVFAKKRFVVEAAKVATTNAALISPLFPANTQIKAKLASENAVADTANITLEYHTY